MAKIDLRHARPTVEKLPDGRQRATFAYTVREWVGRTQAEITAEIWAAWGTVAPGDFTALRLVKQTLQGLEPDKTGGLPLLRVFEEIPESAEVQVGKDTISYGEDGGKTIVAEFLQFSSATYTPGTIGTTTAPGDATLYLQTEDAQDDGTLRRIKRTYIDAGTLSTAEETRNNGALSLITITSVKTEPATPTGYTRVSTSVKNADGVPVYTYSFAKGNGLVDYTVAFSDFTTAGANGITRLTLRYLASPGSSVTPSSQSGYVQISSAFAEADGHRVWTTVWAKGAGTISTNDDTRNNGALLLRTIKSLGTAPSTPSDYASTPVSADVSNQDGFQVYTYTFAKGVGEISRESRTGNNGALLRLSIGYLTAPAAAEPTPTSISGYTKINVGKREADGHLVWSLDYVQGVGEISRDIDYSQSSDEGVTGLTRTTIRYLVAPAGTIQPTTLSGSVLVGQSVSEEDGHRVWTTVWAKGTGTIRESVTYRNNGKLAIARRTALGAAPSPPGVGVPVASLAITGVGAGYSFAPTVSFTGGGGTGAAATAVVTAGAILTVTGIVSAGSGWTTGDLVAFTGDGTGAIGSVVASAGGVTSVTIVAGGSGYTTLTGGMRVLGGTYAMFGFTTWTIGVALNSLTLTAGGFGYTSAPTVVFSGGGPPSTSATATATLTATSNAYAEISSSEDEQDGVTLYTKEWAVGEGVIDIRTNARGDGLRTETWVSLGETYDDAYMLPAGVLLAKDSSEEDGTKRWIVTCIQNASGTSPLVGTTVASVEIVNIGNAFYFTAPTVSFSGGGGSGAAATAAIDGNGILTGITVTAAGSGYTSAPLVTLSAGLYELPTVAAILSNGAITQEKLMSFTYPGRAKAIALEFPGVSTAYNLDVQLSPPIDAMILGAEEVSYRADNSLSDLTYPLWSPTEWATVFAQYVDSSGYVSKCEGIRGYRAVVNSGGSTWVERVTTSGYTSVLGRAVTNVSGVYSYLRVFGGPDAPDGQTFTLDADCELAFVGYDGTRYYRRTVRYATIPAQNAMPDLTTAGVAIIALTVTNVTTLRAVATSGVTVGGRTNAFRYTWTQGGVIFVRTVRATLAAGTLANETTFYIKPTDYNASTNAKYWVLA